MAAKCSASSRVMVVERPRSRPSVDRTTAYRTPASRSTRSSRSQLRSPGLEEVTVAFLFIRGVADRCAEPFGGCSDPALIGDGMAALPGPVFDGGHEVSGLFRRARSVSRLLGWNRIRQLRCDTCLSAPAGQGGPTIEFGRRWPIER